MTHFDNHFDKNYADKMRQQTDLDFSGSDWEKLSGRLDEAGRRRPGAFPIWLTGLLAGLLLFSNLIWFLHFSGQQTGVPHLEKSPAEALCDTVFQTVTERSVDTVYLRTAQNLPEPEVRFSQKNGFSENRDDLRTASSDELLAEMTRRFPEKTARLFEKNALEKQAFGDKNLSENGGQTAEKTTEKPSAKTAIDLPPIALRQFYPIVLEQKPVVVFEKNKSGEPILREKRGKFFKNDWWMTSYSGGWLLPISKGLIKKTGYSVAAQLEYGFKPNQSVWLELSQTGLACTGNATDDYGVEAPYKHDYRLTRFETVNGMKKATRIGLGGRLRQPDGKKWGRLGIGFGHVWEFQDAFDLKIDWENYFDPNDRILGEEATIAKHADPIGYLHGDIGIEWRLGKSWLGSLNVWKEAKANFRGGLPGYFGVKAGAGYKF